MNLTQPFKSLGHFFATAVQRILADTPKIEASATAAEGSAEVVETVSAALPVYGPLAVTVEKAGYALIGELIAVLHAGDAAAEAKLADAGLDINVINTVKAIAADPSIKAVAKMI